MNFNTKNNLYLLKTFMASATEIFITEIPLTSDGSSSSSSSTSLVEPTLQSIKEIVFKDIMNGNWHAVADKYKENKHDIQTASITSSKETVLHIAISDNRSDMALELLKILKDHPEKIKEMKNDRGNNPLHLAASLGQADICEVMVSMDPELILSRNNDGETPLFLAALHGKKEAFFTLHLKWAEIRNKDDGDHISHCKRNDGNSILHVAILGEYFELAFQIFKLYPKLSTYKNDRGQSALHILATNPSAFRSGCHLGPLDDFIYRCFLVEQMEVNMARSSGESTAQQNQNSKETKIMIPGNYEACFSVVEMFRNGIGAGKMIDRWKGTSTTVLISLNTHPPVFILLD